MAPAGQRRLPKRLRSRRVACLAVRRHSIVFQSITGQSNATFMWTALWTVVKLSGPYAPVRAAEHMCVGSAGFRWPWQQEQEQQQRQQQQQQQQQRRQMSDSADSDTAAEQRQSQVTDGMFAAQSMQKHIACLALWAWR